VGDVSYDLVVVGAGIVGSAAAALAVRSGGRVLLLDRSLVGRGATQYSAGIDVPLARAPWGRELVRAGESFYRDLREREPASAIFPLPLLWVVSESARAAFESAYCGPPPPAASAADVARARAHVPSWRIAPGAAVYAEARASIAYPVLVAEQLARAVAAAPGSAVWEGVQVEAVEAGAEGVRLTVHDGRRLAARRVLVATGPWLAREALGGGVAPGTLRVKKIVALHLPHAPEPDAPGLVFFADDAYLVPLHRRGHWLFSFTSDEWDVAPEPAALAISARDRALARAILDRHAPALSELAVAGRVFCDAYTADRLPFVAAAGGGRLAYASGGSGSGYRLAPGIAAAALARLAFDQENLHAATR
jgi:glycine/D-amino acid oxidase-like deaminating enzyme